MCVRACARACVRVCVPACARACVRVCLRVCVCMCAYERACMCGVYVWYGRVWVYARTFVHGACMRKCLRIACARTWRSFDQRRSARQCHDMATLRNTHAHAHAHAHSRTRIKKPTCACAHTHTHTHTHTHIRAQSQIQDFPRGGPFCVKYGADGKSIRSYCGW